MINHVSYSMFELWNTCRECFKYKYIMKLKGETPQAFLDGQQYHDNVHLYHTGKPYDAGLIKAYTDAFSPEFREESETWLPDNLILKVTERDQPSLLCEVGLPVKGKIDGKNGNGIVDLKFMKGKLSQKQADSSDQPTFYVWANYMLTNMVVPFWYQCVDKVTGKVAMIKTERGIQDFYNLALRLNNFIAEVEEGDFTPIPGHKCRGACEFINICSNCGGTL
jgi:hypothetical protein